MSVLERVLRKVRWNVEKIPRVVRAKRPGVVPVDTQEVWLTSTAGYQLRAHLHAVSAGSGPKPGVLLCPGINDSGEIFASMSCPVNADELAREGFLVLRFDPAGRGRSWGNEDFGGAEHQDNVRVALRYLLSRPDVDAQRSGIVAISLGVAMAVGAAAQYADELEIGWLIDWEGPCDREIITAGGTMMDPADGHKMEDDAYWHPREAVRHVGNLRCGYLRVQAAVDHAQPGEFRHATRMMRAAQAGDLPWFQLNDHPRGDVPARPIWYPSGAWAANRVLIRKARQLAGL